MVRLTDCPDMSIDVYHGCKTTTQQQHSCSRHTLLDASVYGVVCVVCLLHGQVDKTLRLTV